MNAAATPAEQMQLARQKADRFLAGSKRMLIDGEWTESDTGTLLEAIDPASEKVMVKFPAGSRTDVDRAVKAARRAFGEGPWPATSGAQRGALLWRLADLIEANIAELAALETYDNGAPVWVTTHMIQTAIGVFRYYAGMASKIYGQTAEISDARGEFHAYTRAEPVGVVGAITPWNAPLTVVCNKVAPALAAGCTCVVKPPELTSLTALRFGELAQEVGIPPGVINIVTGLGSEAGQALAEHPDVDKISFTGSTATGRRLIAAAGGNFKRLTLELGGKSPLIIMDDADLERAVPGAAMAIFANSGQVCFAGSRLFVHASVYDRVVEGIAEFGSKLKLGNGFEPDSQLGPVVSRTQLERVMSYIGSGVAEGVRLVTGGKSVGKTGYFVQPTVFANVNPGSRIAREEIFGPVLVANRFDDLSTVLAHANDTLYGLGAGIYTRNVSTAHRVAKRLYAGNVWINCYGVLNPAMPFGGFKESGWGREFGTEGIQAFLETKAIYTQL
jgi:acyl-CoA reductase-like NAD-dependent aldehyde dehydrogenase